MFDTWNERSPRWWAVVPLRLPVGYGFIAHGLAKYEINLQGATPNMYTVIDLYSCPGRSIVDGKFG